MEPMDRKNDNKVLWVYKHIFEELDKVGIKAKINIMDNEASLHICSFITNTLHALFKNVTQHCHQASAAKKAIQTAKHLFIASLASTDSNFPEHQWNDLFVQVEFMLNVLWPTKIKPKIPAYTYLFSEHNYNAAPLVPTG